jgi:hypothetical protein
MDNEKEKMVFTHVGFISSHQKITVFFHFWWDGVWQRKGIRQNLQKNLALTCSA